MKLFKNNDQSNLVKSLAITFISNDAKKIGLIQNILSMSDEPKLELFSVSNGLSKLENIEKIDLIILDKNFGPGDFIDNLSLLKQINLNNKNIPIFLLLDEKDLNADLMKLSESLKLGASDFILVSEFSLNNLLKLISKHLVEDNKNINETFVNNDTEKKVENISSTNKLIKNHNNDQDLNFENNSHNDWMNIAKSLPIMCLVLNQEGYITKVVSNDFTGMNFFPNAKEGQTLNDIFEVNTFDNFSEAIKKTLNTGITHQQTIAHTTKDGTRWLDTFITNLRGNLDLSRQVIWTAFDVTAGRQSYQELLKNHDSLTETINEAPIIFCQRDINGRFQRVNRTFCEAFNVRADIIAGRQSHEIFSGLRLENMTLKDQEIIDGNKPISYHYNDKINNNDVNIYWKKFPLKSEDLNEVESIASFGFVFKDSEINTNKQNENSIASDIPTPIIEASGAINQDFKTVIKNISNYTEIAISQKNKAREKKVEDHIRKVIDASEKALTLLSKNKSNDKNNHVELIKLDPLVSDIVDLLKPTLPSNLNFNSKIENINGKAYVIPSEFRRLVMQLIISARDNPKENFKNNVQTEILLSLKNEKFKNKTCINCNEKIDGDYITLSVTTSNEDVDTENLKKMIESTDLNQIHNEEYKESKNVIIMAHRNSGHVLLELNNKTICLKLLFKNIDEKTTDNNSGSKKKVSKV